MILPSFAFPPELFCLGTKAFEALRVLDVFRLLQGVAADHVELIGQGTPGFQLKPACTNLAALSLEGGIHRVSA